jgi:hypothetical protein
MKGRRTLGVAVLGLLLGAALGLLAGWVVWPVEYDSVTPDLLASNYQIDYAKMIAVVYARSADPDLARAQLARLGPAATDALRRAAASNANAARLLTDLDTLVPPPGATATPAD